MTNFPLSTQWQNFQTKFPQLSQFSWHYDYNSETYFLSGPTKFQGVFITPEIAEKNDFQPNFGIASENGREIFLENSDMETFINFLLNN